MVLSTELFSSWLPSWPMRGVALRLPDPTRLWRELRPDEAPPKRDDRTLCQKLEPHLVRLQVGIGGDLPTMQCRCDDVNSLLQELSLWTDAKSSALALLIFHLLHQHMLSVLLGSTVVAAVSTLALAGTYTRL